jgi:hypothetical protein
MLVKIGLLSHIYVTTIGIHFIFTSVVSQKKAEEGVYIVIQEVKL